ncbi:uncharacterized protein Z518_11263 [Rhinocladiella mackenziei CBS 650.93]|uniref:Uncharacterized protein n=1 Tax=Rhinocladiella mackenziei CBS 650.93 TaxID=1442369 RepID=A0A0D2IS48_9EURO|nr:uncharacterized protein Z518_11263 [Rhinocladiella mackenziei CBS 650.93]KIW99524.1 hypothetical protein Z518_11263 [Rhinocladiella mackenziei CBS 650.93]
MTTWDPLQYCSPEELSRLEERFDYALRDVTCLVFWTGVPLELAQRWAEQHGLPTLTIAMGPLYSGRDAGSARCGKSSNAWSKYMKGASGLFAEYACRGNRQAVVLAKPPPIIYSTRKRSNYRDLEEPILKGVFGGPGTVRIEYVHPTVTGAATFQYQVWPLDRSSAWYTFFGNPLPEVPTDQKTAVMMQGKQDKPAQKKRPKAQERQKKADLERQKVQEKKETNRKRAELEQRMAQEQKAAKRRKAELEQRMAQERKAAKRKRAELEQRMAQEKKEAKRKKAELEQRMAQEKKEAKRKKAELERQQAWAKKEARQKRAELERQKAQEKKQAKRRKVEEAIRKMVSA